MGKSGLIRGNCLERLVKAVLRTHFLWPLWTLSSFSVGFPRLEKGPRAFSLVNGPGTISNDDSLSFTGTGV